jgi:hypothetical protein
MDMTGYISEFTIDTFENFVANIKVSQKSAPEALLAFEIFLETLNSFFNIIENIDNKSFNNKSKIIWYKICQIASGEYVRAKSQYYNTPAFDNVAINMNQNEDEELSFFTDKGTCFGKVYNFIILYKFLIILI